MGTHLRAAHAVGGSCQPPSPPGPGLLREEALPTHLTRVNVQDLNPPFLVRLANVHVDLQAALPGDGVVVAQQVDLEEVAVAVAVAVAVGAAPGP